LIAVTAHNDSSNHRPTRRLRIDEFAGAATSAGPVEAPMHSGRRVVVAGVLALLLVWALLWLAFREWRARYRERAAFGADRVAAAIDPLADVVPPNVGPDEWREAVAETHAALVTVTASNLLDVPSMRALGDSISARVARARARPQLARDELAVLWDELLDRAAPILAERHPRPMVLPPRARPLR
jgi:hypothetical protein